MAHSAWERLGSPRGTRSSQLLALAGALVFICSDTVRPAVSFACRQRLPALGPTVVDHGLQAFCFVLGCSDPCLEQVQVAV